MESSLLNIILVTRYFSYGFSYAQLLLFTQFPALLFTFTEKILNKKLDFLCSEGSWIVLISLGIKRHREGLPCSPFALQLYALWYLTLSQKWSFLLRVSSVNVTKSTVSCMKFWLWYSSPLCLQSIHAMKKSLTRFTHPKSVILMQRI